MRQHQLLVVLASMAGAGILLADAKTSYQNTMQTGPALTSSREQQNRRTNTLLITQQRQWSNPQREDWMKGLEWWQLESRTKETADEGIRKNLLERYELVEAWKTFATAAETCRKTLLSEAPDRRSCSRANRAWRKLVEQPAWPTDYTHSKP